MIVGKYDNQGSIHWLIVDDYRDYLIMELVLMKRNYFNTIWMTHCMHGQ